MTTLAHRLQQAMKTAGLSQGDLAKAVGISQPTINALLSGKSQGTKHLVAIARALDVTPDWLQTGRDTNVLPAKHRPAAASIIEIEGETYARLPMYDIRAQAGRGSLAYDGDPIGWRVFDLNWIKTVSRASIEQLKVVEVSGDSMEPTLFKGDHVLIDLGNRAIAQHGLFVLRLDDSLMVKRVQKLFATATVRIISDNPKYAAEEISEEGRLEVIGRVVWIGRNVG